MRKQQLRTWLIRLLFAVGIMLIVGGWGMTRLAQQYTTIAGSNSIFRPSPRRATAPAPVSYTTVWDEERGKPLFRWGIGVMIAGAGISAICLPGLRQKSEVRGREPSDNG